VDVKLISAFSKQFPKPLGKFHSVLKNMVLQERKGMILGLIDDVLDVPGCYKSCKSLVEAWGFVSG
jgi:hypothetical protein